MTFDPSFKNNKFTIDPILKKFSEIQRRKVLSIIPSGGELMSADLLDHNEVVKLHKSFDRSYPRIKVIWRHSGELYRTYISSGPSSQR